MEHSVSPMGSEKEAFDFEALLDEGISIDFPKKGETREGVIASITPDQILVNVGTKSEGVITGRELESIPKEKLESFAVDMPITVYILDPEDSNGNLVLSYTKAYEEQVWQKAEELLASKEAFESVISGYNKGGLLVEFEMLRGFIPASQIALSRRMESTGDTPEQRWGKMVGQPVRVRIIEVDRERRRLIFSERQASSETRESLKQKMMEELNEGQIVNGRVASLADFGAFITINAMVDGLVHLSEITWDHIKKPSDVLEVGQEVKVKVISIDKERNRIGLSIRQTQEDPWADRVAEFQVGQLVEGTITRLTKFGAFAKLNENVEGLIHISEISDKRIDHPKEVLKEGDAVTLRIIKIDPANHRIGLSIRRVDSMAYSEMDLENLMADLLDVEEDEE